MSDDRIRLDMLDYPTAFALQDRGLLHTDARCSALLGPFLCDCGAVVKAWEDEREKAGLPRSDGEAT
ncbi:hypothetical protein ACFQ34_33495 [Pseudonocardia benzenivorans]|uniref:Uncharacterized protein n=1 Tax=Pseudonocardia benzenivorans TaxID=228005 RepID=A0ABW3VT65_9PSEU